MASTDQMNTPPAVEATGREMPKKITFRFCRECSNMLYPKEDEHSNSLVFSCRTCSFTEPATTACVFRTDLSGTVGATAGITTDVGQDPTLPRSNKPCPMCNGTESVFFQSQQRTAETGMRLYYVCCACGHTWQPPPPPELDAEEDDDEES